MSLIITIILLALFVTYAIKPLPELKQVKSSALPINEENKLVQMLQKEYPEDPNLTGILELSDPLDAFVARSVLLNLAQESIDLQYYIWRPDTSGTMLLYDLYNAAERGVRVRLLLDDNNTRGLDDLIAVLDYHPNIEVRLFNPFTNRKFRFLGYLTDLKRLNHRMHNKLLVVDGVTAITGGRNIGDEYFAAGNGTLFVDLDVMAIGNIVPQLSHDFDRYWNSEFSYPAKQIVTKEYGSDHIAAFEKLRKVKYRADVETYQTALTRSKLLEKLYHHNIDWQWSEAILISDPPSKALGVWSQNDFYKPLYNAIGDAQKELFLVSPYFVPTKVGTAFLKDLREQGIQISVLTNSYEATDVAFVHSGYINYRKALIEAGINIYELKKSHDKTPHLKDKGLVGSSGSSLHAKTFVVDNDRLFVGSLNLDPRSAKINTEMGLAILNPHLAKDMTDRIKHHLLERSYKVILEDDQLKWQLFDNQERLLKTYDVEPNTSILERALIRFLTWLPIEWLL